MNLHKKNNKTIIIYLILIFQIIQNNLIFAETKQKIFYLGFSDAVNLGFERSLDLKKEDNEITKLNLQYLEARTNLYPNVQGSVDYQNYVYMPDIMKKNYTDYEKSLSIKATQLIYAFGKVNHAINLAKNLKESKVLNKNKTQIEISYEIKKAYLNVLYTKELLKIAKQSLENAKKNKQVVMNNFSHGRLTQQDNLKMDRDIATRIPLIKEAEVNFKLSENYLKRLLFIKEDEKLVLTENFLLDFKKLNVEKLTNQMYTVEPNIQLLSKNIQIQDKLSKIEKANKYPTISAYASFAPFSNTNDFGVDLGKFNNLAIAGINMTFPIFENGKYDKKYNQALIDLENSKIELENLKLDLKLKIENEIYKYASLIEIYKSYKTACDLAEKSFKISQERFSFGKIGLLDLNDAELMLTEARMNLISSIFNINSSLIEIEKLVSKKEF